jgi:hypothetical protein
MRLDKQSKARLARTYNFTKWNKPASSALLQASAVSAAQVSDYDLLSTRKMSASEGVTLHQLLWSRSGELQPAISVQVLEAGNPTKASDLMLYLLGQFEGPPLEPARPPISEVAFSTRGNRLVVFERQNLVLVVSNIGDKAVDLSSFVNTLNHALAPEEGKSLPKPTKSRKSK